MPKPSVDPVEAPLLACRLRVPLPEGSWVQRFSSVHPEVVVEVLNRLDLGGGRTLTEVRVRGAEAGPWAEEIRGLPGVNRVEQLGAPASVTELRVSHRTSSFISLFQRLQLMRRFPFVIESGTATWVVVGPEPKVRRLLDELRAIAPGMAIESVRHDPARGEELLTPRQQEVLRRAIAAGYFEVPRRITLTTLAQQLGMAISSLSEGLAIIEKKLVEQKLPDR